MRHVAGDFLTALVALAGFVVHGDIISQGDGQGQLLSLLFLRCLRNAKGEPQPPHLEEPNPANLLCVHGRYYIRSDVAAQEACKIFFPCVFLAHSTPSKSIRQDRLIRVLTLFAVAIVLSEVKLGLGHALIIDREDRWGQLPIYFFLLVAFVFSL